MTYLEIAKKFYNYNEITADFIETHLTDCENEYNMFEKYGYKGLNCLKVANYNPQLAADLYVAMLVSYDIEMSGESLLIAATGSNGRNYQDEAEEELLEIWGIVI